MNKCFDVFYDDENKEVTLFYLKIISNSLNDLGIKTVFRVGLIDQKSSNEGAVVINYTNAIRAKKYGYKFVIFWSQGIAPEEHFMMRKDIIRFFVHSYRERSALRKSDFIILCSDYMKLFYRRKYLLPLNNCYVMPCFNEEINEDVIRNKDYSVNEFVYAGSMAKWQCFEDIVKCYKRIENTCSNTFFSIYTKETEIAIEVVKRLEIKKYKIECVKKEELADKIKTAKFGFCLRDNIAVNKVATPTKLSNYVSNGIIPIYSKALDSFYNVAKDSTFAICVDDEGYLLRIKSLCDVELNGQEVLTDYCRCFSSYYSSFNHSKSLAALLKDVIKK